MKSIQTSFNFNGLQFPSQQVKLTKQEKKLYSLIPIGKENAVQGSYLAETLNIDKRTVIDKVNKLRLKSIGIGSTTTYGYYRFKDQQEYLEFIRRLRAEYFRRGKVLQAMKNISIDSLMQNDIRKPNRIIKIDSNKKQGAKQWPNTRH